MYNKKTIRVYNTHIEISPYEQGENKEFEFELSLWNSHTFTLIPVGYIVENHTLYVPRGIDLNYMKFMFNGEITYEYKCDPYGKFKSKMTVDPRDEIEEDAIKFLSIKDNPSNVKHSQFGLLLDTGLGKTYTMTHTVITQGINAIIITHQDKIKHQWYETFKNTSELSDESLVDLDSSTAIEKLLKGKLSFGNIYFINHQTLNSYYKQYGGKKLHMFFKKIKVGIKIYDEAHKFFQNILLIDYFTNTLRTYYLTATFDRSDPKERIIYKKAFSNIVKYGDEANNSIEPHIVLTVVRYHSSPSYTDLITMKGRYGFSAYNFIDYALSEPGRMMPSIIETLLNKIGDKEGKILITSPKIESTEQIRDILQYQTTKTIATIHSKNTKEENKRACDADIISSTIKSIGTGVDIKGLRYLINLEPISYPGLASQLRGRLRKIDDKTESYLFYLIDMSIPGLEEMFKKILPTMKRKCKKICYINI